MSVGGVGGKESVKAIQTSDVNAPASPKVSAFPIQYDSQSAVDLAAADQSQPIDRGEQMSTVHGSCMYACVNTTKP